ncbi:uncharacterized protein LOC133798145 [Humulus lupulus]|uniref:uncharacterized protein LOC133798145 n=1 Tax=Humulus lupulus TaxID=3486 RepID=UPI002B409A7E|nr:uncharacterized protein LOC133798145 [Humulus lupulus]
MASAATRCGGNRSLLDQKFGLFEIQSNRNDRPCSLAIRNHARGITGKKLIATTTSLEKNRSTHPVTCHPQSVGIESGWNCSGTEAVAYEKLDEWMRDSVVEIVKNLREAPLMLHVYNKEKETENDGVESKMVMEKAASAGDWAVAKDKWEAGDAPLPEGLIFVEELGDDSERHEEEENDSLEGMTRAWGVVIQGKGVECPPACYLLKTSTAGAGLDCGLGFGCTHFCLVRVNSFRETAESQLRNCWL